MNRTMLDERLHRLIRTYAGSAQEARQVARRLGDLLPLRLRDIRREKAGSAERHALVDPRYVAILEELNDVSGQALAARIQYETHTMLFQARQSLRRFHR